MSRKLTANKPAPPSKTASSKTASSKTASSKTASSKTVPSKTVPSKTVPEREALIAELVQQMRRQLQEQLPDADALDMTLDQIEEAAGHIGRQVSRDVQRRLVEQHRQAPRPPKSQAKTQCACRALARYKGQQTRSLVTAHGPLTYTRACYYCRACRATTAPVDLALGLDGGSTTTQVRLWVALLAGQLPFAQAATTLQMLTRVPLSAASVERLSVVIGTSLRAHQRRQAQQHQGGRLPEPAGKRPQRLYIGLDGVFVPLRDAWKKDNSSGALCCRYGECKSGVVYEAHPDKDGRDSRVRTRAYVATLGNVDAFAPLLGTLAHQHGHHRAKEVVVLGDGAPWIWQLAAKQFTGAVQIVDFFHAAQHLAALAEARFGPGSGEGKDWLDARCGDLKRDGVQSVLAHIQEWRPTSQAKKDLRRTTYLYFLLVLLSQCRADALPRLPGAGLPHRQRGGRGDLQAGGGPAAGPGGDALAAGQCRGHRHPAGGSTLDGAARSEAPLCDARLKCPNLETHPFRPCRKCAYRPRIHYEASSQHQNKPHREKCDDTSHGHRHVPVYRHRGQHQTLGAARNRDGASPRLP